MHKPAGDDLANGAEDTQRFAARLSAEGVLITDELDARPLRAPDPVAENAALVELMAAVAETAPGSDPSDGDGIDRLLQKLVEAAMRLCGAHSCGISMLEGEGEEQVFRWRAVAGAMAEFSEGAAPRDACPCGLAVARDAPILLSQPGRVFAMPPAGPMVEEVLLTPFRYDDRPVGTIWLMTHDASRRFDGEDLALVTRLSGFATLAYRALEDQRRRVEEDAAHRFKAMADAAPAMLWVTDREHRCTFLSRGWFDFTGQNPADALGFGWTQAVHPDDREAAAGAFVNAADRLEPFDLDYRLRRADGEYRWSIDAGRPQFDDAGNWVGHVGSVIDVHGRRDAERRLATLVAHLPGMAYRCLHDADFTLQFVSDGAETLTGYPADAFIDGAVTWAQLIHPDDVARVRNDVERGVAARTPFQIEYRIVRRDGGIRWVYEQGEAVFESGAGPVTLEGFVSDVTERKVATDALADSERRFRSVVEQTTAGIAQTDLTGRFVLVNDRYCDIVARPREQLLQMRMHDITHPDDLPLNADQFRALVDGGDSFIVEKRYLRPDGSVVWVRNDVAGIRDGDGRVTHITAAVSDISERKRAVEEAHRAQQLLEGITRGTDELIAAQDHEFRYLFFNDAYRREFKSLWGGDIEVGAGMLEAMADWPEQQRKARDLWARALAGESFTVTERFGPSEQATQVYELRFNPIRDAAGLIIGAAHIIRNVTEQHRMQDRLRASEARYRAIVEGQAEMVCRFRPEGEILFVNGAYARAYGTTPEALVGTDFWGFIDPDDRPQVRAMLARLTPQRPEIRIENRIQSADGVRWTLWTNRALEFDAEGGVRQVQSAGIDITDQKLAEQELERSRDELERRVAERTVELQQRADQLSRLTSQLTLAEQRERRRLAQMLHDHLQQLLASARIRLDMARHAAGEGAAERLTQVTGLIDEAMTASRSLTVELSPPILHDAGLAAGLEWLARWMREKHGLTVRLDIDRAVAADREDVRVLVFRSIRELLFNVVKHAGVREATVRLAAHDATRLRAVVADGGEGFDASESLAVGDGVTGGFGLFSIRERLSLMGGELTIESAPGAGATFTIVAPRTPADESAGADSPAETIYSNQTMSTRRSAEGERIRVMLVDDHDVVRQGLASLVSGEPDMEVVGEASDGIDAVERAGELRPDIVLMDFSMPRMDGVEAARRICERHPEVRIIGLSMYQEPDRAAAMIDAGAAAYLTKSGESATLLRKIREIRRGASAGG